MSESPRQTRRVLHLVAASLALGIVLGCATPGAAAQPVPAAQSPAEPPHPAAPDASAEGSDGAQAPGPDADLDEDLYDDWGRQDAPDPWQRFNRGVFGFNQLFDRVLLDPVFRGYRFAARKPARQALFRAFRNIRSPAVFTNHVLQLRFGDAARTAGRFLLNSTLGVGGLLDAGKRGAGWEHEPADFGQTLGRYGLPGGPYLLLPILGPSSLRDVVGTGADFMLDPLTYVFGPLWWIPTGIGEGFTRLEAAHADLQLLEAETVDFYAALRNVYHQHRLAAVQRAKDRSWCPLRHGAGRT